MARTSGKGLSAAEATRILDGYERSSLTRRDYCKQVGIPVTTLDYYRRRHAKRQLSPLVAVKVIEPAGSHGFALVLSNGRRIESDWGFGSEELARLVRVAEQA
jgi:hypothetical protein